MTALLFWCCSRFKNPSSSSSSSHNRGQDGLRMTGRMQIQSDADDVDVAAAAAVPVSRGVPMGVPMAGVPMAGVPSASTGVPAGQQ